MELSGKHPKTSDTKWARVFTIALDFFKENVPVHNPKSKLCLDYLLKNYKNLVETIVCPFCDALK